MSWSPTLFEIAPKGCPSLGVTAFECDHAMDGFMEGDWSQALIAKKVDLARKKVREKAAAWYCKAHALLVPPPSENKWLPSMLCIAHLVGDEYVDNGGEGDYSVAVVGFFVQPAKDKTLVGLFESGLSGFEWGQVATNFDY